jgi:hypothetical protein
VTTRKPKSKLKRRLLLALLLFLLFYGSGYAVCRLNKSIVHYASSVDGKCTGHGVDSADVKIGGFAPALAALFTPLRYLELGYWKLRKPDGAACA